DGKMLVGGDFNGVRSAIARLNTNDDLDTEFQNAIPELAGGVESIAVQPDNRAVIVGGFSMVQGASRNGIARLNADGTLDNAFQNGTSGADNMVECVALQPDGKLLIGGYFSSVNGIPRKGMARLNADGALDGGFQASILSTYNNTGPIY